MDRERERGEKEERDIERIRDLTSGSQDQYTVLYGRWKCKGEVLQVLQDKKGEGYQ